MNGSLGDSFSVLTTQSFGQLVILEEKGAFDSDGFGEGRDVDGASILQGNNGGMGLRSNEKE